MITGRRRLAVVAGLVLAIGAGVVGAVPAFADVSQPDSYFTAHVAPAETGANANAEFIATGDIVPQVTTDCSYSPCGHIAGTFMQGSTHFTSGWGDISYPASSSWPCCLHGVPVGNIPGPVGTNDALNINGGLVKGNEGGQMGTGSWEWCGYFDPLDQQGQVLLSTAQLNTDGTVPTGALYVALGTIDDLVVAVRGSGGTGHADVGVANNGFTSSDYNLWQWMCVSDSGGTFTVHWPNGGSGSFAYGSFSSPSNVWGADGDLMIYGYSFWPTATGGNSTYQEPGCALMSPPSCGTGTGGTGGTTPATCPQQGIISGAPKFQWCPPQLGCNNFDTGWNIGQDIQWLGCAFEQVGLAIVAGIVNAALDLVVPDFTVIQTQWDTTATALQTHEPLNYVYGALTAIPSAFAGAHTTPTLSFHLPAPWSFNVNITWSQIIGGAAPYRTLMAGLLYFAFAAAVTINARRAFEN